MRTHDMMPSNLRSHFTGPYDSAFDVLDGHDEAANLNVRAQFISCLANYIDEHDLMQIETGARIGVNQSRVSHLLSGRISMFSVDALIKMCDYADMPVRVSFSKAHAGDTHASDAQAGSPASHCVSATALQQLLFSDHSLLPTASVHMFTLRLFILSVTWRPQCLQPGVPQPNFLRPYSPCA